MIRKRADGFHDIRTTIQSVDLHDLLTITKAQDTLLTTSGLGVTKNADNSVLKAHAALERACKQKLPANFHLHKRIPPGSGMGGGSSDAAAALRGLKAIYNLDVDLTKIAEELGSDVPYFLQGGCVRAEGRGEKLTPLTMQPAWFDHFIIAWPELEVSTKDVYQAWDEVSGEGPNQLRRAAEHIEPRLKQFAEELGPGWQMTGSGSAFFTHNGTAEKRKYWTATAQAVGPWA